MSVPLSLWLSEAEPSLPHWEEAQSESVDVLVIGAGLAGLATARALAAAGRQVRVLDRDRPGNGASGRNAGFVLVTHVTSYPAMRRGIGADLARVLLRLAERNHAVLRERFGVAAELRAEGSLMLGVVGDASEAAVLAEAHALLREDGVKTEFVPVPEGLSGYDLALRVEKDGEVHPARLVAALATGVDGRLGRVESIDRDGHTVLLASGARIEYRTLVLATNAWTSSLVPELDVSPQRAQMLATAPLPSFLSQPCYAGFGYEYFRQRSDGRVLLGGRRALFRSSEATADPLPTDEVQRALEAYLRAHMPSARDVAIERRWAGTMGFSADGLPLLGTLAPDLHTIVGFTGHGLGTALACAELLTRALTGCATDADRDLLVALAPGRRPATFEAEMTPRAPQ